MWVRTGVYVVMVDMGRTVTSFLIGMRGAGSWICHEKLGVLKLVWPGGLVASRSWRMREGRLRCLALVSPMTDLCVELAVGMWSVLGVNIMNVYRVLGCGGFGGEPRLPRDRGCVSGPFPLTGCRSVSNRRRHNVQCQRRTPSGNLSRGRFRG